MQRNHSAVLCEVCKGRLRHGRSTTVGRRASGTRRAVCDDTRCQREWKYNSASYMRRWPEMAGKLITESVKQESEEMVKQKRRYITAAGIAWLASKVWAPGTRRTHGWKAGIADEGKRLMPKDFPGEKTAIMHRINQIVEGGIPAGLRLEFDPVTKVETVRRMTDVPPQTPEQFHEQFEAAKAKAAEPSPEVAAAAAEGGIRWREDRARREPTEFVVGGESDRMKATALFSIIESSARYLQDIGDIETLKVLASLASEKVTK